MGEQIAQFITEHGSTARLKHHHGNAGHDLWFQSLHGAEQVLLSLSEETVVVKRPSATQLLLRDAYFKARCYQHIGGGERCIGEEVIVEGVRPKNDRPIRSFAFWRTLCELRLEGSRRECRDLALR